MPEITPTAKHGKKGSLTATLCAAFLLPLALTACVTPNQPRIAVSEAQALLVKDVVADMKSGISASADMNVSPAVEPAVSPEQKHWHSLRLPSATPEGLVMLSSSNIGVFSPVKPHVLDAAPNWFQDGSLASVEECAHCKAQGNIVSISSEYGKRRDPKKRSKFRQHKGIDIRAPKGSGIMAFKGGEVIHASRFSSYGLMVEVLQYDGVVARYAHMNKILVKKGEKIGTGDKVGEVGRTGRTTGAHLHFELLKDGESMNPMQFLEKVEQVVRCLKLEEASR